ncbi:MAG TPA: GDSL-type esterase/lipase family protein, partial [Verrucomicrobiae bacterium]|nr:GDSL-type esterase/lipase family protein [Verrucomicrobiae bacterium]
MRKIFYLFGACCAPIIVAYSALGAGAAVENFESFTSSSTSAVHHAGTVYSDNLNGGNGGVLSILGSSVAKGYNSSGSSHNQLTNGSFLNSYAADLTTNQANHGWQVVNQSVPGDTTPLVINRFYRDEVPVHPDEDLIGLSLGNEGLGGASNPQAIYNQFFTGITNLIAMSRANNILPLVAHQYPKDAYSAREYAYLKKMDLQLNTLDAPGVNFLGATDDGAGHWVNNAFINLGSGDGTHPSDAGHYEMFLTIVPSVFDALKNGKPTPQWGNRSRFLRINGDAGESAPLSLAPSLMMHSFSVSFRVRSTTTGTVASVTLPSSSVHPTVEITATGLAYRGINNVLHNSGVNGTNGTWHDIVVAHQYARGLTWFYVDGVLASTVAERLTPVGFVLGGHGNAVTCPGSPAQADYQNWFVHRSMLNAEEVEAQYQGNLQQASLELYAPLDDNTFDQDVPVTNRAQSYSVGSINGNTANYSPLVQSLAPPASLLVSSNHTPAMILNWTDPDAATEDEYYVERSAAGGPWTTLTILAAHATSYTDLTVGFGSNYQYRVSYSRSGQRSDYSVSQIMRLPFTNAVDESVLIDLGRHDGGQGAPTTSPDVNGNYWNSWSGGAGTIANGNSLTGLVTINNNPSEVTITAASEWNNNGYNTGGLLNPNSALLGEFAIG